MNTNTENIQTPEPGSMAEFGAALDEAQATRQTETPVPSVEEQPSTPSEGKPTEQDTKPTEKPEGAKAANRKNAERRIQKKRELRHLEQRNKELEAELAELKASQDPNAQFRAQIIEDRLEDNRAIEADHHYNEFKDRAIETFGDEGVDDFMAATERYAEYVNTHEHELLAYVDRPYGQILLREWYRRMDNPNLRRQWLSMTQFEKSKVLDGFYTRIGQIAKNLKQPAKPAANAPVPGSGRVTNNVIPDDDFGMALQEAQKRRRQF